MVVRSVVFLTFIFVLVPKIIAAQWRAYDIVESGTFENRITILILSEGYTIDELERFREDAERVASDILSTPPFSTYKNYFRVVGIEVESNESGASAIFDGEVRDTYFKATFSPGFGRDISLLFPVGTNRLYDIKNELNLGWWNSLTMILVNDDRLGGSPEIVTRSSDSFAAVVHELGHQFAQLADEYIETGRGPIPGPNVTTVTDRAGVPWVHWIRPETPIPSPQTDEFSNVVGLFEGAAYQVTGWFRPQLFCRMLSNYHPFCAVCHEQIIRRIYVPFQSNRIMTVFPGEGVIELTRSDEVDLSYSGPEPEHGLHYTWRINGQETQHFTPVFNFDARQYATGMYKVELVIEDKNDLVASPDIRSTMRMTRAWDVNVIESSSITPDDPTTPFEIESGFHRSVDGFTTIRFTMHVPNNVKLTVYDILGRQVAVLAEGIYPMGTHQVTWFNRSVATGIYFVVVESNSVRLSKRMVIVR